MNWFKAKTNSTWGPVLVICLTIVVSSAVTATAAKLITGKQIKNSSVTSVDIKNKSLTGNDVKDGTLLGADVKDGDIGSTDIADGSVSGTDVSDGSVSGTDIQDGSVAAADLQTGAVPPPPVGVVTDDVARTISASLLFSDVPGMSVAYTAPAGTTKLLVTYSAECKVTSTAGAQYVSVQIVVDGTEASPQEGASTQFCTTEATTADSGTNEGVNASMQRVISVGAGAHTVKVQATTLLLGTGTLDGQLLSVQPAT